MTCDLELVIATADTKLFDTVKKGWSFPKPLWWAVGTLINGQYTVSDAVLPGWIHNGSFQQIATNPTIWNSTGGAGCPKSDTQSFHVLLTFNPGSKDPADYLQYVFTLDHGITDYSTRPVKVDGQDIYLSLKADISIVGKYIELWLSSDVLPPSPSGMTPLEFPKEQETKSTIGNWIFIIVLALASIIVLLGLLYLVYATLPQQQAMGL